ncbi:related to KEX1 protein precursor [Sporisorium reilianum f. sp. reilianum]|uniref:Pheromone-processing carboxypeptidase KEX1 n=1 Tax=Sporisorium reilianum f. sp. reilianum TaxID=72559 RepID=A0A2N8UFH2_9BASI|nr:related to KEX1 protein precursor [Sporisorium reilianum f. sp. reilianum]
MPLVDPRQVLSRRGIPIPAAASFHVPGLPDLHAESSSSSSTALAHPLQMSAGYLPARPAAANGEPKDNAHLFFLLLRARHVPAKRKLIIWFNGGPGCSSFDGAMMEVGAWRMDGKGGLVWVKDGASWNEYADILFLDQPVGTGFSYVNTNSYTTSLPQAADEVVHFLEQFVQVFPEYSRDVELQYGSQGSGVDVFLAGESFAGQYIPYTAKAIVKASKPPVSLKGIAIGNGFIDPKSQYGTELETMVQKNIWSTSSDEYKRVAQIVQDCHKDLDKGGHRKIGRCEEILQTIIASTVSKQPGSSAFTCINVYDVRLSDTSPACGMNWPTTLSAMYDYLRRPDVRKALHVDEHHKPEAWVECNANVGSAMRTDTTSPPSVELLPDLLASGVKVLLFAGEEDLICNAIGVRRAADNLEWNGSKGFGDDHPAQDWYVNGSLAGSWRTARNLTYVGITGGSHMVGVDKPIESHDMMVRFMGIDYMKVAGPNALIPSRVGNEPDRILVTGGGGGVAEIGKDGSRVIPGSGKTEGEVAEEARWRAYYDAGSFALMILLVAVGVGTWLLLRSRKRRRMDRNRIGRGGALRLATTTEFGGASTDTTAAANGDNHELERLVGGKHAQDDDDVEEAVFDVGEEDLNDSNSEADVGVDKSRRAGPQR